MESPTSCCTVCERTFTPKFRYQVREVEGRFAYYCSQVCQEQALHADEKCSCSICHKDFVFEYAYQATATDTEARYFCSTECRQAADQGAAVFALPQEKKSPRRIAVFNHKGGTGKTTTAVNLAAALAEQGKRVLLVDADGQGNVGASLGIRGEKNLYHVLVLGMPVEEAAVPVRNNLDVLTSNELLAAAELYLAGRPNRDRVMRERLGDRADAYDVVVIDCAPALSLMNQNALVYADSVVVPVSCDYLSLVGVRQVLRTIKNVREMLKHDITLLGVVPTFFDVRNKICREAVDALQEHFGERCLPPIRINTKLREAPSVKQTIFEYAKESNGAIDYLALVEKIMSLPVEMPTHHVAADDRAMDQLSA
ncbi:MAG: ParA family protein [Sandaracinaceae bacterium]|jgi:chromosome partitioning protein|nr:ParA family protein [Sandaracinaceae bacterium]